MSACPSSLAVRSSCSAEADRSANTFASSSAWLYRRVSLPRPAEDDRSANTLASSSAWLYRRLSLPRPAEADRSADPLASSSAWLYRRVSLPRPAEADRSANTLASSSAWLYRRLSLPRPTEADRSAVSSAWLYKWVSLPRLATRVSVRASSAAFAPPQAANPSTPAIATGAIHRSVLILEFVIVPPPWFRVSITRQGDDAPLGQRAPHQTAQIRGAVGHRP